MKPNKRWNIPVPIVLDDMVEKAIKLDMHVTKSDFVRDAVREKLEKMGIKPTLPNSGEKGHE